MNAVAVSSVLLRYSSSQAPVPVTVRAVHPQKLPLPLEFASSVRLTESVARNNDTILRP